MLRWIAMFGVVAFGGCRKDSDNGGDENGEGEAEGEAEAESEGESVEGDDPSIYDIQRGNVALGDQVAVRNVVVTAVDTHDSGNGLGSVFVQEPEEDSVDGWKYSGILIYRPTRVDSENGDVGDLVPGDVVNVNGIVDEFALKSDTSGQTTTEISDATVERVGSTQELEPQSVALSDLASVATAEPWEGVLIQVSDVQAVCKPNQYDVVEMVGDGGTLEVAFDYYGPDPAPTFGDCFESVTGPLDYFFTYRLQPRDSSDVLLGGVCGEIEFTEIADIQAGMVEEGDAVLRIQGVVTAVDGNPADDWGFFVQAGTGPYSGIYVYGDEGDAVVGDDVIVSGSYTEFVGVSEMTMTAICSLGAGTLPVAETVSAADAATEEWEGVLVRVENVTVTNPDAGYGDYQVDDVLRVDDEIFDFGEPPVMGSQVSAIVGPIQFSYDEFRIMPRSAEDIVE